MPYTLKLSMMPHSLSSSVMAPLKPRMMMKAKASGTPAKLLVIVVKLTMASRRLPGTFCKLAAVKEAIKRPRKALPTLSQSELVKACA